jgi:hypothetical protein
VIHRLSRIRVRPRRKGRPSPSPEQELVTAALAAKQVELNAQLHDHAAQIVRTTLDEMQQRADQAARTNPELAPYVNAYLLAAGRSLIQETTGMLDDQPIFVAPPHHQPQRRFHWRFSFRRLIPVNARKEQPDGAA